MERLLGLACLAHKLVGFGLDGQDMQLVVNIGASEDSVKLLSQSQGLFKLVQLYVGDATEKETVFDELKGVLIEAS